MVGVDEQGPFRNKNGLLSQNVLAACSFDLKFHYVLAGWEGSASDLRVLNSALTRKNKLLVPEGNVYHYSLCCHQCLTTNRRLYINLGLSIPNVFIFAEA